MMTTVEGIYKEGHVELLEKPAGIEEARLLVTFLDEKKTAAPKYMKWGQFKGPRMSTEDDFKDAEWHGEPEFFPED